MCEFEVWIYQTKNWVNLCQFRPTVAQKGQLICQNETILVQFPLFYPKLIDSLQKRLIFVNLKSVSIKAKDWANLGQFGPNLGPECNLNIKFCNIQHLSYQ